MSQDPKEQLLAILRAYQDGQFGAGGAALSVLHEQLWPLVVAAEERGRRQGLEEALAIVQGAHDRHRSYGRRNHTAALFLVAEELRTMLLPAAAPLEGGAG